MPCQKGGKNSPSYYLMCHIILGIHNHIGKQGYTPYYRVFAEQTKCQIKKMIIISDTK